MLYYAYGGEQVSLSVSDMIEGLYSAFDTLVAEKSEKAALKIMALPPDITRYHSKAGLLTVLIRDYFKNQLTDIMPALGTHNPMTPEEIDTMFPGLDHGLFRAHRWRSDLATLGVVPADYVNEVSEGAVSYDWPAQVNKQLIEGGYDYILSIGQVVPHEVIGFANHNKNIFVGTGGVEGIHKSHFLGAAYGMERIMGRIHTPVRKVLNYASDHFARNLPIVYILTVVSPDSEGRLHVRGLFIGDDYECYERAAELSLKVNFTIVEKPFTKAVVYLDPSEFRSTWLGNKAIYRTRMAMADDGELHIIAPGLKEFGEDTQIDALIRKYGYKGTPATMKAVEDQPELADNLSAAAHLIHGSSEGRFSVTYAPGHLSKSEIEGVGYKYSSIEHMTDRFKINLSSISEKNNGYYTDADGEEYYFIQNPALGLWSINSNL